MEGPMITTTDNPFNPFTHFDEWRRWDEQAGYHTCAYLGRVARVSYELSDADYKLAIEAAIDEIIKFNVTGKYKKIWAEKSEVSL